MTRNRYVPSPLAKVEVRDRSTLVFVRELAHSPEQVWNALTDPAELSQWAPFDTDRDLGRTGDAVLTMAGEGGGEALPSVVRCAERPKLLEYTWGNDVLRWELEPSPTGTRLTLVHTLEDPDWITMVAPGWHLCVDVMSHHLAGEPVGRIVGSDSKKHGWEELRTRYAAALNLG
jgi:uncharacterized protein YndB with AHSA1/START domain